MRRVDETTRLRTVEGPSGELLHVYHRAIAVGPWRLDVGIHGQSTFSGEAGEVHAVWSDVRPLTLRLFVGRDVWTWDGVDPVLAGGRVVAELAGPPRREVR